MREYIIAVLSASALLAVLSLLSYKSDGAGKKLAFAVLFIWACFVPIARNLINFDETKLSDFDFDISDYDEDYLQVAHDAFASGVASAICEKFSLDGEGVRVLVEGFDFESMTASHIRVFLSGRAVYASYKDIEKYIEDSGLGECDVEIEIEK